MQFTDGMASALLHALCAVNDYRRILSLRVSLHHHSHFQTSVLKVRLDLSNIASTENLHPLRLLKTTQKLLSAPKATDTQENEAPPPR